MAAKQYQEFGYLTINGIYFLLTSEGWSGGEGEKRGSPTFGTSCTIAAKTLSGVAPGYPRKASDPPQYRMSMVVGPGITSWCYKEAEACGCKMARGEVWTWQQVVSVWKKVIQKRADDLKKQGLSPTQSPEIWDLLLYMSWYKPAYARKCAKYVVDHNYNKQECATYIKEQWIASAKGTKDSAGNTATGINSYYIVAGVTPDPTSTTDCYKYNTYYGTEYKYTKNGKQITGGKRKQVLVDFVNNKLLLHDDGLTASSSSDSTTTTEETQQTKEEPAYDPVKIWEEEQKNAYSNIVDYGDDKKNSIKVVAHSIIMKILDPTIVVDEMSKPTNMFADNTPTDDENIRNVANASSEQYNTQTDMADADYYNIDDDFDVHNPIAYDPVDDYLFAYNDDDIDDLNFEIDMYNYDIDEETLLANYDEWDNGNELLEFYKTSDDPADRIRFEVLCEALKERNERGLIT